MRGGETLTITATADNNYILDSLKINNTEVETENGVYIYEVGTPPTITRIVNSQEVVDIGAKIEAAFIQQTAPDMANIYVGGVGLYGDKSTNTVAYAKTDTNGTVTTANANEDTTAFNGTARYFFCCHSAMLKYNKQ